MDGGGHSVSTRNLINASCDIASIAGDITTKAHKFSINDYLQPVTELRQIKRIKFDPDSPRFSEACTRL